MNEQPLLEQVAALLAESIAQRVAELVAAQGPAGGQAWRWVDVDGAAEYLSWPKGRLEKLNAARAIPHHRVGNRITYRTDELDAWLDQHHEGPARLRAVS